jgi:hypothetical protein
VIHSRFFSGLRLALLVAAPILFVAVPFSVLENGIDICLIKRVAGVECPGCGMTRALHLVAHGDFTRALVFNRGVVIVAPLLFGLWCRLVWSETRRLRDRSAAVA